MAAQRERLGVSRAKVAAPRLSARYVPRPRLLDAVAAARPGLTSNDGVGDVVLLSAPAGYGKTLLLADWAARNPDRTAWVNLDPDDSDDRRFWSAVLTALGSCPAVGPDSALLALGIPDSPSRDPEFLAAVVNTVDALDEPVALVLDELHELTGDPLHGLTALVRDRPARLLLVLATRFDPPLRLERLRLTGHLREIRAHDLAFTAAEAGALLAGVEVSLRAEQLRVLLEETDGWPAGLRLLALALRDAADPDPLLVDLVHNEHAISDYLVGEILSRQPPAVRDVLDAVSLCDAVTSRLAVVVSGRADAGDVLATLEHETSLVTSYGDGRSWFRLHPMLRAQLRAGLQRRRPDLASAAHRRAAGWFAEAGEHDLALHHAQLADDPDLVVRLLHGHGARLATSGQHDAVCRALDALPAGWQRRDPELAVVAALAYLESGQLGVADRLLDDADAAWPAEVAAPLLAARDLARARRSWYWPGRGGAAGEPRWTGAGEPDADVGALLLRANAAATAGELHTAAAVAGAAVDRAERDGNAYLAARATTSLAIYVGLLGEYSRMVALAARSNTVAPVHGWRGTLSHSYAQFLLAYGALLRAEPARALELLDELELTTRERGNRAEIHRIIRVLGTVREAARFDLGEHRAALRAMRGARVGGPRGNPLARATNALMALLEHGAAGQLGWREEARDVLAWAEQHVGPTGDVLFLRACGPASISRYDVAREHLRPLLDGAVAALVSWVPLAGWVLEGTALLHTGRRPAARRAIAQALALAGPSGVLRPLVAAPDGVAELVAEHRGEGEQVAREVLVLRSRRARGPSAPLTGREREVLDMLPTVLSLEEIAEAMAVSLNTVKTHIRGVYGKLGTSTRRDAVDAARRIGLLEP